MSAQRPRHQRAGFGGLKVDDGAKGIVQRRFRAPCDLGADLVDQIRHARQRLRVRLDPEKALQLPAALPLEPPPGGGVGDALRKRHAPSLRPHGLRRRVAAVPGQRVVGAGHLNVSGVHG